MQSVVFAQELNQINSAEKPIQKQENGKMNPFFQYVSSSKTSAQTISHDKTNSSFSNSNDSSKNNRLESYHNPSDFFDPRRPYQQNFPLIGENSPVIHKAESVTRNDELKQKRSRSRDRKTSKRNSQTDNFNNQKKEQHYHKTKICPLYEKGQCRKGSECKFAHGFKELRCLPNFVKTRLCIAFKNGECKKPSEKCKYAHGEQQLRSLKHDGGFSDSIEQRSYKKDFKEQKHSRNEKQKQYESVSRVNKPYKKSQSRQDSRDSRYKNPKLPDYKQFYKKNIPITTDYQRFLYGGELPNVAHNPDPLSNSFINKDSTYSVPQKPQQLNTMRHDPYAINLGESNESRSKYDPTNVYPTGSFNRNFSIQKPVYAQPTFSPVPQNNAFDPRPIQGYSSKYEVSQKAFRESLYPSLEQNQLYQYPCSYQNPQDFSFSFSKDYYENSQKKEFEKEPFSKETSLPKVYLQQKYSDTKNFSSERSNLYQYPSSFYPDKVDQKQPLNQNGYPDNSVYSSQAIKYKKYEDFGNNPSVSSLYSKNQSIQASRAYPSFDNPTNQSQKYQSYSYEKKKYNDFQRNRK